MWVRKISEKLNIKHQKKDIAVYPTKFYLIWRTSVFETKITQKEFRVE